MNKVDYDFELQPYAERFLEELKAMKPVSWWRRLLWDNSPKSTLIKTANSVRAAWFVCRNPFDPVSEAINDQYHRILGRAYNSLKD